MNKAFTKTKKIELDSNWSISPDSDSGVVLVFKTTKENKKGEVVPHEESFYYPRIAQALRFYADKNINSSKSIEEAIAIGNKVYQLIEKLDKEFKQF